MGDGEAPFFQAFGHFIWQFATMERVCHMTFHSQCGLSEDLAKTLIGNEQLSKVTKLLNGVVKQKGEKNEIKEMQDLVDQINAIGTLRHNLVHRGTNIVTGNDFIVTNMQTARTPESIEILKVNIENIRSAIADLEAIVIRLFIFMSPHLKDAIPLRSMKLFEPWRYKSLVPDRPHPQPRKDFQ